MATDTVAQRARKRAAHSRLRAHYSKPVYDRAQGEMRTHGTYKVYNLSNHKVYTVWYNTHREAWECTCPTPSNTVRCKHIQRVLDREEKRIRKEALRDE